MASIAVAGALLARVDFTQGRHEDASTLSGLLLLKPIGVRLVGSRSTDDYVFSHRSVPIQLRVSVKVGPALPATCRLTVCVLYWVSNRSIRAELNSQPFRA